MKCFLLIIIKAYWFFVPKSKRRVCIYRKSCSNHVYEVTNNEGLFSGLKALRYRIKTCRPGYEVIYLAEEDVTILRLINGSVLQMSEISENMISLDRKK